MVMQGQVDRVLEESKNGILQALDEFCRKREEPREEVETSDSSSVLDTDSVKETLSHHHNDFNEISLREITKLLNSLKEYGHGLSPKSFMIQIDVVLICLGGDKTIPPKQGKKLTDALRGIQENLRQHNITLSKQPELAPHSPPPQMRPK